MPKTIVIELDQYDADTDGFVPRPVLLTAEAIADVVVQACNVVTEADGGTDLWGQIAELREALESYSLIDRK